MTKPEAKELSLKVWRYLAEHSWCMRKRDLPFYNEIADLELNCPLCEVILKEHHSYDRCLNCPLGENSFYEGKCDLYNKWNRAVDDAARVNAASIIVELIEGWDTGEDD